MNDPLQKNLNSEAVARGSGVTTADTTLDRHFLARALELAWRAAGSTYPNPMVGAVVVKSGEIVGEGFHTRAGSEHAEIVALENAGERAENATLYVTLEPCVHQGKTPPCVDRIISSGIKRVVACTLDPDVRVNGRGRARLKENGIQVEVGGLGEQAIILNLPYFERHSQNECTVTLKVALTMDGKIASAPEKRDQITGLDADKYAHKLRATHDTILVGIDTLLTDRPILDCRLFIEGIDPIPVVLDTGLRFPLDYPWIEEGRKFFVCCGPDGDAKKIERINGTSGRVLLCKKDKSGLDVKDVVSKINLEGIKSVLVEGGGRVFSSFLDKKKWDVIHTFISPFFFGEEGIGVYRRSFANMNEDAIPVDARKIGRDFLLRYLNKKTCEALLARLT